MRFLCECGHLITDTSDFLPYKAYMISDVDWEDYWEAHEREALGKPLGPYQEPMFYEECGRLYFDDPDDPRRFISFTPEDKAVMVTGPSEGERWKGFLRGYFYGGHGHVCWHHATGEEYHEFDDYGELKAFFDGEFERLRREGAIRSAWINKDGETAVFKWDLETAEPAPLKSRSISPSLRGRRSSASRRSTQSAIGGTRAARAGGTSPMRYCPASAARMTATSSAPA